MPNLPAAAWRGKPVRGVLFDLDGTLLDTAADIACALNRALAEYGVEPLPVADVSRMIGRGSPVLIERAAAARGLVQSAAETAAMLARFMHHYDELEEGNEGDSRPYPGAAAALERLHTAGLGVAVVTNKYHRLATSLLNRWQLLRWVGTVVGGDTCARRKPDPEPLLFACGTLGFAASEALMVGDSVNDVRAARAAGMPVVCVPYGYNEGQDPHSLECDQLLDTLADLPDLLWPGYSAAGGSSRSS